MNRPEIGAVALDVMDTVIRDPWREALEEATGLSLAEVLSLRDPRAWIDFERGLIDEEACFERFFPSTSGRRLDGPRFRGILEARYRFVAGMEELLGRLAGTVRLFAHSNYPVWGESLWDRFAFDRFFEQVVLSSRLGARKPEARFFSALIEAIGLDAGRILVVDDREANLEEASRQGMPVLHFTNAAGFERGLRRLGLLAPEGPR